MNQLSKTKRPLLLLHGALGSADSFLPLRHNLQGDFDLHCLDFEGHGKGGRGGTGTINRPFRMEFFVENVLAFLKERQLDRGKIHVFGYSMGGYVALLLAKKYPELFQGVFTLGTKLFWTIEGSRVEAQYLHPEKMEKKIPQFVQNLKERHGEDQWKTVVEKTADLLLHLGDNDLLKEEVLGEIKIPVRIGIGDKDQMAGLENGLRAYRHLPNGELAVWPRTGHPLELMDFSILSSSIRQFCGSN